jgi:hypothetical protein
VLGVDVPATEFFGNATVAGLAEMVESCSPGLLADVVAGDQPG